MQLSIPLIVAVALTQASSFTLHPSHHKSLSFQSKTALAEQNDNNSSNNHNNENYRQNVDSMRKILEASWKEETMGLVPTTPERAASNAAEAVLSALSSDKNNGIFLVDISLPSMDPMSGENVYDDVGAAEFCIGFAEKLNENRKSCDRLINDGGVSIVVKDQSLVSRIERCEKFKSSITSKNEPEVVEFYDDFADFNGGNSFHEDKHDSWDDKSIVSVKNISLKSILGEKVIEKDKDMIKAVVKSIAINGSPGQNDDVIIILAPMSQQELVGVRWLVSKYGNEKTIIIFNNKLNPLPNELMMAETCYCVFPLIARSATSSPLSENERDNQPVNPKIVLLRRFPRNWEIYIDINEGSGFELAGSVPAVNVGMRGPSMDWIAGCVKKYMQTKLGK